MGMCIVKERWQPLTEVYALLISLTFVTRVLYLHSQRSFVGKLVFKYGWALCNVFLQTSQGVLDRTFEDAYYFLPFFALLVFVRSVYVCVPQCVFVLPATFVWLPLLATQENSERERGVKSVPPPPFSEEGIFFHHVPPCMRHTVSP